MEPACLLTHPATGPYASGQAGQHDRFDAVRTTSTALAAPLSPEAVSYTHLTLPTKA